MKKSFFALVALAALSISAHAIVLEQEPNNFAFQFNGSGPELVTWDQLKESIAGRYGYSGYVYDAMDNFQFTLAEQTKFDLSVTTTDSVGYSLYDAQTHKYIAETAGTSVLDLAPGTYAISMAGSITEGRDAVNYVVCVTKEYGSVAAVPEPETYAMMVAGLGVLGAMARRRRQK